MRRFYVPAENIREDSAHITGSDVHHIKNVLRKTVGEIIPATDGMGNLIRAKIVAIDDWAVKLEIIEKTQAPGRKTFVKLFQALPRGYKFDWIIEKASELGVSEIVPVITERTASRLKEERGLKKIARWERIALESAKQTGRSTKLSIHRVIPIENIEKSLKPFSIKIVPWELEEEVSLKNFLQEHSSAQEVEVLIGPEGGLSVKEVDDLKTLGFRSVSLGSQILKTETAAIITVGNIFYQLEG